MSLRLILAVCAAVTLATPTLAAAMPTQTAAPAPTNALADLQAKAAAFQTRMEGMEAEMKTAVTAAAGDETRATADLDAIVARYQPEADAFAREVASVIEAQAAIAPEEQRAAMAQASAAASSQLSGIPAMTRAQALQPPIPVAVVQ